MAVEMSQVLRVLQRDETDYQAAAQLGPEAMPHLIALSNGEDSMLAAKAVYMASLIGGMEAGRVLAAGMARDTPEIRISVAAGLANVEEKIAKDYFDRALRDQDASVRQVALYSVQKVGARYALDRVHKLAKEDPKQFIREIASEVAEALQPGDEDPFLEELREELDEELD